MILSGESWRCDSPNGSCNLFNSYDGEYFDIQAHETYKGENSIPTLKVRINIFKNSNK